MVACCDKPLGVRWVYIAICNAVIRSACHRVSWMNENLVTMHCQLTTAKAFLASTRYPADKPQLRPSSLWMTTMAMSALEASRACTRSAHFVGLGLSRSSRMGSNGSLALVSLLMRGLTTSTQL